MRKSGRFFETVNLNSNSDFFLCFFSSMMIKSFVCFFVASTLWVSRIPIGSCPSLRQVQKLHRALTDGTYTCSRQDISADLFDRCSGSLQPPVSLNLLGIENCGSLTFRQWPKSVSCEQQKFCKSQVSNFLWWSCCCWCFGHATWEWVFIEFMIGSSRCASLNVMPHYTVWQ